MMEYPKIALKSDSTKETGERILSKLISLGGRNTAGYCAMASRRYYFIDSLGRIDYSSHIPEGYTLVALEQKQKLFKLI